MEKIKFNQIESVIIELFRKNNSSFITSRLSEVMLKIFTSLNGEFDEDARYMKSSIIPHRVYYIYSEKVSEKRLYDFVILNDEPCIWIYSNNMINAIGTGNSIEVLDDFITNLIKLFKPEYIKFDSLNEHTIVKISMIIRILKFLKENYGSDIMKYNLIPIRQLIINFVNSTKELENKLQYTITDEYIYAIYENYKYDNSTYYSSREYLDEYKMLLDYIHKDEDYE